jgi:hypothetical protein
MRMVSIAAALMIALGVMAPNVAHAGFFVSVGAGCVADPASAAYVISNGKVLHGVSSTGTITLYCPIPMEITAPSHVELLYEDSTTTSGNNVTARYIKMHGTTGASTIISTLNSDSGTVTTGSPAIVVSTFSDTYDSGNYRYYVRIDIARTTTSPQEYFYGVSVY